MAGSKKWFIYTTDGGIDFAILLDESNTEAVNGSTQDLLDTSTVQLAVPRNIRPRSLFYSNTDGTRTIKCVALTPTIYTGAPVSVPTIPDPLGTGTLRLVRVRAEVLSPLPRGIDTGLNDGDAT
jgi:hypothetical protein